MRRESRGPGPWFGTLVFLLVPMLGMALVPGSAAATVAPPEARILAEYLAQWDDPAVQGRHCARHGGYQAFDPVPRLPHAVAGATNALLYEHTAWHFSHGSLDPRRFFVNRTDADLYGEHFFLFHHEQIHAYEAWRAGMDYPDLVPWDPATPIPLAFAWHPGPGCEGRNDEDPRVELPTWATEAGGDEPDPLFGYTALCEFPTINRFTKSIDADYHGRVHGGVGGDMRWPWVSPRDPIFWAWHLWVDDVLHSWEACGYVAARAEAPPDIVVTGAQGSTASVPSGVAFRAGAPGAALWSVAAFLVVVAGWKARDRARRR